MYHLLFLSFIKCHIAYDKSVLWLETCLGPLIKTSRSKWMLELLGRKCHVLSQKRVWNLCYYQVWDRVFVISFHSSQLSLYYFFKKVKFNFCICTAAREAEAVVFLIHETDPQSRPVVIIVSACRPFVHPSVPTFPQNNTNIKWKQCSLLGRL